jgi:hypothetical protein
MSLDPAALRTEIQNTLKPLNLYSPDAEELLMATCAQESLLGTYRHQVNGPAIGIYQMEPATFNDIWTNYLAHHEALGVQVAALAKTTPPRPIEMQDNDAFSTAMARVLYLRTPQALPPATDLTAIWAMYKKWWNSELGAATQDQFFSNYRKLVNGSAQ